LYIRLKIFFQNLLLEKFVKKIAKTSQKNWQFWILIVNSLLQKENSKKKFENLGFFSNFLAWLHI
jgi:hypothetical protein